MDEIDSYVTGTDQKPLDETANVPTAGDVDHATIVAGTRSRLQRTLFAIAGAISLGLAVLGIFLPLLPTTPLVLLAAFCFARSSKRLHTWLLRHRVFGPIVREWEEHRRIPARAKWLLITLVIVAFIVSALTLPKNIYAQVALLVVGLALVVFLARIPTNSQSTPESLENES